MSGRPAVEIAGVVLYALTISYLLDHFKIVGHPFFQSLGFEFLANVLEVTDLRAQIKMYA